MHTLNSPQLEHMWSMFIPDVNTQIPAPNLPNSIYYSCIYNSKMSPLFMQALMHSCDCDWPSAVSSELTQLSGVAAILRFPIADLSEPEDSSSSDEDWSTDTGGIITVSASNDKMHLGQSPFGDKKAAASFSTLTPPSGLILKTCLLHLLWGD